jgi:alkylated DNA repair dioxygenase AlkB
MTFPKYEYIPEFLSGEEALELYNNLEKQDGFKLKLEIGQCNVKPSHATVQWGPRQSYLSCIPKPYRVTSSGDVPNFLRYLKTRLEGKYNCYFDSIQVNKHFNQDAEVKKHPDSPPGHICMISLGAEREFQLHTRTYQMFANPILKNGSLLTFLPKEQWRMVHSMPKSKTPCGARYSIIFRYITDALTKEGSIGKVPKTKEGRAARISPVFMRVLLDLTCRESVHRFQRGLVINAADRNSYQRFVPPIHQFLCILNSPTVAAPVIRVPKLAGGLRSTKLALALTI